MWSAKAWSITCIIVVLVSIICAAPVTAIIDPYFHYRKPLEMLEYPIDNQRYQNNGIVRHFDYDAIITGTSMTENFKTSEFDELFNVCSVKVPFSGGSYKEINDNLERAVAANPEMKMILRCLDYYRLLDEKDTMPYRSYPAYLYDDSLWNDLSYVLNKDILKRSIQVCLYTLRGEKTTTFDEYSNWSDKRDYGEKIVYKTYNRIEKIKEAVPMTAEDKKNLRENLAQNVTGLVESNPQIDFYLFFPPYSIYSWDQYHRNGTLNRLLDAEKMAIEILLEYENIHLFSFTDHFNMICDLDNYMDITHYGGHINSQMLEWMAEGKYQITKENYQEYCDRIHHFYSSYDYDSLFV